MGTGAGRAGRTIGRSIIGILTNLAGFGLWVNSVLGREGEIADGVKVICRNDSNYSAAAEEITKTICIFAKISEKEVADYRKKAAKMAEKALWKHFIKNYLSAYNFAMEAAAERTKK